MLLLRGGGEAGGRILPAPLDQAVLAFRKELRLEPDRAREQLGIVKEKRVSIAFSAKRGKAPSSGPIRVDEVQAERLRRPRERGYAPGVGRKRKRRDSPAPAPPTRGGLERQAVTQLGFAAFALIFAVPQSCIVGDNPHHAAAMATWPAAPGKITESRSDPGPSTGSGPYHIVGYTYVVDGKEYAGDRVTFNVTGADPDEVAARVQRYYVGRSVEVRHDPDDPSVCALEAPRYTFGDQVLIKGVPVLYGLAGLFIALALWSGWRSTRLPPG